MFTEVLLIVLIIVMVAGVVLLALNLQAVKKKETTPTSSKPISLTGLSSTINSDKDVIEKLEKKEKEEQLANEQKEVLKLMTANREQAQYKKALSDTIKEIKSGGKKEVTEDGRAKV